MKKTMVAAALAAFSTVAFAQPGYVTHTPSGVVMNPYGLCWHSGSWTAEQALASCDAVPRAAAPIPQPQPVAAPAPAPAPVPAPVPVVRAPQPEPKAAPAAAPLPVAARAAPPEKITLSADLLFAFNSATLRDAGKEKLDELAARLRNAQVADIKITGHADRIGGERYNQRISEERAAAVKAYLQKTAGLQSIRTQGMGKSQPVTGDACKRVRPRAKLIECLQPDRRVDIEISGTRTAQR